MTMNTVSAAPGQRRTSTPWRGVGRQSLEKIAQPASGGGLTFVCDGTYWRRLLSLSGQLVTSAVAGTRALGVAYCDGDGYVYNLVPISNEIGPSQTVLFYGDQASVTPVQAPESHQAEGSQTSPAAGTTITSLTLPSGGWTLSWVVQVSGTVGAPELDNFQLAGGNIAPLTSVNGNAVGVPYPQTSVEVQTPVGGATYTIKNVILATTGAVYAAQLVATPANVPSLQVQLPDFTVKSGWQINVVLTGAQAGDQMSGLGMLFERYPSSDTDIGPSIADEVAWAILAALGG